MAARNRSRSGRKFRDGCAALSILDPDNAYRYLEIGGKVVDITETGAEAHIDSLAKTYMGVDTYPFHQAGVQRVIYKIGSSRESASAGASVVHRW